MDPIPISRALSRAVDRLSFGLPVTHVYNPLAYARAASEAYLERYAHPGCEALLVGMNPGPYGMAQTGVPFGEVSAVRDWLKIEERIDRPVDEHPRRPVDGFDCTRSEVSGARLWGAIADHWHAPEAFFRRNFIANYCPLVFMEETGRNRTPDKLPAAERGALYRACDDHLQRIVDILEPEWIVGIGAFAENRARTVLADYDLKFGRVLHPSPASPKANRGWADEAGKELRALGLCTND